ncbi:MAG: CAP domain-containing protein [Cyanobacteria bacterium P01_D01_bin.36]
MRKAVLRTVMMSSVLGLPASAISAVPSRLHVPNQHQAVTAEIASTNNTQTVASPEAILAEINRARQSPVDYALWLASLRRYYTGTAFRFPGERGVRTVEGAAALDGAIAALSARSPAPPLTLAPGLVQSTRGHLSELLTNNRFTLSGLDGRSPLERAERYGSLEGGRLNELLNEGFSSAEAIVAFLIIDDGNRSRSVQDALLSADITTLGSACGRSGHGKPLCVLDYAQRFASADTSVDTNASADKADAVAPPAQTQAQRANQIANRLPQLAAEMIAETNVLRANPAAYAQKLIAIRQYYQGNLVAVPGQPLQEVVDGVAALDEAIAVLQSTAPLPLLVASDGMSQGARDHALDLGSKNLVGHYGSDNSDPFVRINRYGRWDMTPGNIASENISYGYKSSAEWHIIQLLIDDNVPNRGHREALLKPDYRRMGSACAPHPTFDIVCVMTYASEYEENG